jgi:hypothetical protein
MGVKQGERQAAESSVTHIRGFIAGFEISPVDEASIAVGSSATLPCGLWKVCP